MKSFRNGIGLLAWIGVLCACSQASEYVIELKANGEVIGEIALKVEESRATATIGDQTEQFNLQEMTWLDEDTGQWVDLAQCKSWVEASKAKSLKNVGSAPAEIRQFLLWSLDPKFEVVKTGNELRLTSGQVDYVISGIASKTDTDAYFRYAVLSAYKKAIKLRKSLPYAELKAIEEMRALGIVPMRMTVKIPGIPRSPVIETTIQAVK